MRSKINHLRVNLLSSPKDLQSEISGPVVTSTALQILFRIDGKTYILGGPQASGFTTLIGGLINDSTRYIDQINANLKEETLGRVSIRTTEDNSYELVIKNIRGSQETSYPIKLLENVAYIKDKTGAEGKCVTFTAVCDTLTLPVLENLSQAIISTTDFWRAIGELMSQIIDNFETILDEALGDAKEDEVRRKEKAKELFATFIKESNDQRFDYFEVIIGNLGGLEANNSFIDFDPEKLQLITSFFAAREISIDFTAFKKLFGEELSRYSDRRKCYVCDAQRVLAAAEKTIAPDSQVSVFDTCNREITTQGIPPDSGVKELLSRLFSIDGSIFYNYAVAPGAKGRYHYYTVCGDNDTKYEGLQGDALKTQILKDIRNKLDSITDQNTLDTFLKALGLLEANEDIVEAQPLGAEDQALIDAYKHKLKVGQGCMTRFFQLRTTSVDAVDEMVEETQQRLANWKLTV